MTRAEASGSRIASLSELARHVNNLNSHVALCTPQELYARPSGVRGLERLYGFRFDQTRIVYGTIQEGYASLGAGRCDCALGYTTDGELVSAEVEVLRDDLGYFLASNLTVGIRTPVLQQTPALEETLRRLSERLSQEALAELTAEVVKGVKPRVVARRFLRRIRWKP
jgi:glycine betaine/choline ABC-type transport system substrate-binding protein